MTAMSDSKTMPAEVIDYLRLHHIVTVSTSSFTGMPNANTVAYTNDPYCFFFFVTEGSQLMRNITDSRYVAVTIDDYTTDWRKVRELRGVGQCMPADSEETDYAATLFEAKFGSDAAEPTSRLYRMTPFELHFLDYDYDAVLAQQPQVRTYQLQSEPSPSQGAVATSLDQLVFEPGEVILRSGDRASGYFVVLEGQVEIRHEGHGLDQTVVRVGPGEMFGDRAALRGQAGAVTAHAVERTIVLQFDRSAMRDLLMGGSAP